MNKLETILESINAQPVIGDATTRYSFVDLSETALNSTDFDIADATQFEAYVNSHLAAKNSEVAVGGYKERRNIYRRSAIFNDLTADERNIHMGIDLWKSGRTAIKAPIDGIVHSFANNTGIGNYGPTIILQHDFEGIMFYTLYGHLSLESLDGLIVGKEVAAAQTFCYLGEAKVNGDYAPHLHFQIIADMGEKIGDFAGVCSEFELPNFCLNCPDPNLLLKLKT